MYCISIREEGSSLPEGTATAAQQSRLSQGDRQQKGSCCFGFTSPRTAITHDSIHDSIHETGATPSVSLAAVVTRTLLCVCVFSKTMYLDRQRYTVFWPYTICRPNTKTKTSRTRGHTTHRHTRTDIFWGMYKLETRFARINISSYHSIYSGVIIRT